jgi:hypothetical protein
MHLDSIALLLSQWEQILASVDDTRKQIQTPYSSTIGVWDLVEKSVPIILNDVEFWLVSILYLKRDKKFYLDVREYKLNEKIHEYEPTINGLRLSLPSWLKLLEPIYKLLTKHKGK